MANVPKGLFKKDAVTVAQQLLGKVIKLGKCTGMIVETEAYMADPASHAWKKTPRSEIMFDSYGKWYIYFIYGMYYCVNITTNDKDPGAVLIRAVEPLEGIDLMKKRRKTKDVHNLCSGPGKLCQAFGITKKLNGCGLDKIQLLDYKRIPKNNIAKSSRIGIKRGTELDWRFYVKNSNFMSK